MTKEANAMVLEEFNRPLKKVSFPVPVPEKGQVLVKLEAAGVCGSDVHMWRGKDPRTPLPVILGHEGVGRVTALEGGKETVAGEPLKEGDLILWHRGISCGKCYYCLIVKEPSLCENRLVYGINRGCALEPHLRGSYSSHILLDADTSIFKLPPNADPAVLVAATCSGSTVAHAFDLVSPSPGDTVLVQGPGPLGVFAIAFAVARGATKIIVIGGTDSRLDLCADFGATELLNRKKLSREERFVRVMELTEGRGVDYAVEAAGTIDAMEEGISLVRRGGAFLAVGFGEPRGKMELDCFRDIVLKNLYMQGVWVSDVRHTHMAKELILSRQDLFAKMITHRLPLNEANKALELMEKREAMKVVLRD